LVDSSRAPDYYAVLQVHPSADQEVIEAAYRQLMKKHHPDVAGTDSPLAAQYHQQAKVINQAHTVLRDPVQRRRYDTMRGYGGARPAPAPPPPCRSGSDDSQRASGASNAPPTAWAPSQEQSAWVEANDSHVGGLLGNPFAALSAAYYLLPGPYEWEGGHGQEFFTTCLLPPVGIAAFALATGRLAPWVGHAPIQTLLAWGILLILVLPSWSSLPRLAMAGVPSVLLFTANADSALHQASVPTWLAWVVLGFLSLLLSARMYLFAVLPTLGACWLLTRLG
jgi:DnaJ domain